MLDEDQTHQFSIESRQLPTGEALTATKTECTYDRHFDAEGLQPLKLKQNVYFFAGYNIYESATSSQPLV